MDIVKAFQTNDIGINVNIKGSLEEPLFRASDIGEVLEIGNIRMSIQDFDNTEKCGVSITDIIGREQETTFLTEKGLYKILFKSRKPIAKQFTDWVCEVIKEIRLRGKYDLEEQLKIKNKEVLDIKLTAYDNKPVVYLGIIPDNCHEHTSKLVKFGSSDHFKERYFTHKREISTDFEIIFVIETKYHKELENMIKQELKKRIVEYSFNNKKQKELIEINDSFTVEKIINQIKGFEKILSDKTDLIKLTKEIAYLKERLRKYEDVDNFENIPSFRELKEKYEKLKCLEKLGDEYEVTSDMIKNWFNYLDPTYKLPDYSIKKCIDCKKEINKDSTRCNPCASKIAQLSSRKAERPPFDQLIKEIKETSFVEVGKKYKVSDNAIRKWVKNYDPNYDMKSLVNLNLLPKPDKYVNEEEKCIDCGKHVKRESKRCPDCYRLNNRKVERPTLEELNKQLETKTMKGLAKEYNVSPTTLKKWVKNYEKTEI